MSEFAQQTAHQYYNMMLSSCAVQHPTECSRRLVQVGSIEVSNEGLIHRKHQENDDNVQVLLSGKYEINVPQAVINEMQTEHTVTVAWLTENTDKNNNRKYNLSKDLVRCLHQKITHSEEAIKKIIGYTRAIVTSPSSNERSIFYSHPCYQGEEWYDWAMVHFEEKKPFRENVETFYPSRLLGLITSNGTREAVNQCSLNPLSWDNIQQNFVVDIEIGQNFDVSFVFVPIKSIVHPLCIIPDDGDNMNKYFAVLPKQNWSRFFWNNINR